MSGAWQQRAAVVKGYRVLPVLLLCSLFVALLQVLPAAVRLPERLSQVPVRASVDMFAGLPVAIAIGLSVPEPAGTIASTTSRGWARLRVARLTALTAYAAGLTLLLAPAPGHAAIVVVALVGEVLLGARLLGPGLSWILPLVHVVGAAFVGTSIDGRVSTWAWPAHTGASVGDTLIAGTTFLIGLSAWSTHADRDDDA
jgi:hypothetical protein